MFLPSGVIHSEGGGVVVPFSAVVERQMGGVLAVPLRVTDAGTPPQTATVTLTLARASGRRTLKRETKHISVASIKVIVLAFGSIDTLALDDIFFKYM